MTHLYSHQTQGRDFILNNNGVGALYFACGLGKTLTVLEIYREYHSQGAKLLVICPLTLIYNAWIEDIKKFTTFTYQNLHDDREPRPADIYLMNYEMILNQQNLNKVISLGNTHKVMIVLDESSRCKNPSSATSKRLLAIKRLFPYRILLSGTPAPNGEHEYFAQMKFLSDTIFSSSFYTFRSYYFHLARGHQVMDIPRGSFITREMARKIFRQGFKYQITETKRQELMEAIRPWVMFRDLDQCVDLPESVEIIRKVTLAPDQAKSYKEMKNHLVTEIKGEFISAPFALTKLTKLRQISSGFLLTPEGQAVDFAQNAKLEELKEVLEELGDKQAIIWTWFVHESEVINKALRGADNDTLRVINGTVTDAEKNESLTAFKDGRIKYLVANPQSIAHGVTLTNCHYCIYFSLSYSHEQLYQSIHRIRRIGQTNKCFYIYLLGDGTIDEVILDVLKRKGTEEQIVKEFLCR